MLFSAKTTILSAAFVIAATAAAQAQGVANLPPAGAQPATVQAPAIVAPTARGPNPGSGQNIATGEHYQKPADYDSNQAYHPYSTKGAGPNPGTNASASNTPYTPPPGGETPMTHPYSQKGTGPNPGR